MPCEDKNFNTMIVYFVANGWYVYIETSSPRKPNDKARLISATVPRQQQYCFKFWYHMYGPHVNALNIYKKVFLCLGFCQSLNLSTINNTISSFYQY